jgi:hypothetical protein
MKKLIIAFLFISLFAAFSLSTVKAGGDKVRGDEGEGDVNQIRTEIPDCWDTSWCEQSE